MSYSELILPIFSDDIDRFPSLKKKILEKKDIILVNPYAPSYPLGKGKWKDLRGLRSVHWRRNTYVFLIAICEECIKQGYMDLNIEYCGANCTGEPMKRVVFVGFNTHDLAYGRP